MGKVGKQIDVGNNSHLNIGYIEPMDTSQLQSFPSLKLCSQINNCYTRTGQQNLSNTKWFSWIQPRQKEKKLHNVLIATTKTRVVTECDLIIPTSTLTETGNFKKTI